MESYENIQSYLEYNFTTFVRELFQHDTFESGLYSGVIFGYARGICVGKCITIEQMDSIHQLVFDIKQKYFDTLEPSPKTKRTENTVVDACNFAIDELQKIFSK